MLCRYKLNFSGLCNVLMELKYQLLSCSSSGKTKNLDITATGLFAHGLACMSSFNVIFVNSI